MASSKPGRGVLMRHRRTSNDRFREISVGSRTAIMGATMPKAAAHARRESTLLAVKRGAEHLDHRCSCCERETSRLSGRVGDFPSVCLLWSLGSLVLGTVMHGRLHRH